MWTPTAHAGKSVQASPGSARLADKYAFLGIIIGIFSLHAIAFPLVYTPLQQVYSDLYLDDIPPGRWLTYCSALVAIPSVIVSLYCLGKYGVPCCTFNTLFIAFVGAALRALSAAYSGSNGRHEQAAGAWMVLGNLVVSACLPGLFIAGAAVAANSDNRVAKHLAVVVSSGLGLALGGIVPHALSGNSPPSIEDVDATFLMFGSFISASTLLCGFLMWRAMHYANQGQSPRTGKRVEDNSLAMTNSNASLIKRLAPSASADDGMLGAPASPSALPANIMQLGAIVRDQPVFLLALSFAFTMAPMLATFGGISSLIHNFEYLPDASRVAVFCGFAVLSALVPLVVPLPIRVCRAANIAPILTQFTLLFLAIVYALILSFTADPNDVVPQILIAAIAIVAVVAAGLGVDRTVSFGRDLPALTVAAFLCVLASGVALLVCGLQEVVLLHGADTAKEAMKQWVWVKMGCFLVSAAATTVALWEYRDIDPANEQLRGETSVTTVAGEDSYAPHALAGEDSYAPTTSNSKAVWWQNMAATGEIKNEEASGSRVAWMPNMAASDGLPRDNDEQTGSFLEP